MKTATIPVSGFTTELREAAESVLEEGESFSAFVELSIKMQIDRRRAQTSFVERGLASRDAAKISGEYYSSDDVLAELDDILANAETQSHK